MSRNFLLYWRPETVEWHLQRNYFLNHAGSNQLDRVRPGDRIWIVTLAEGFELGLAGRLRVGEVLSLGEARVRLGVDDLWPSRYHALARAGTAEHMRGVSLSEAAEVLRFIDGAPDRITVREGKVDPEELTVMRELSVGSVRLLSRLWAVTE